MKKLYTVLSLILLSYTLIGCGNSNNTDLNSSGNTTDYTSENTSSETILSSDMFSTKDMEIGYDADTCTLLTLSEQGIVGTGEGITIEENTVTISDEGTYLITGNLSNGQIIVNAENTDKIQIVLDNITLSCDSSSPIYIKQADKVFLTTTNDSINTLTVNNAFIAIDENNIDSVIFSKEDLTLNGNGTLILSAKNGNGITSKDDLVLTSGTYNIAVSGHGLEGKNSIRIADGNYEITAGKDGLHSENTDDTSLGFIYIANGIITLTAEDDGIHAASTVTIENGNLHITKSNEGIEGQHITIASGNIQLQATDDGLNATSSSSEDISISITGGVVYINADGDGIDSNGNLFISGGETYVFGPTNGANGALDYNGTATISGGTFIALGGMGMAQNFGTESTQGSMLVNFSQIQSGLLSLSDENGAQLLECTPKKQYQCAVISTPDIEVDKTYTLTGGTETQTVTMTALIYGASNGGMGGKGSAGGKDSIGGKGHMQDRENMGGTPPTNGEIPTDKLPEGEMPSEPPTDSATTLPNDSQQSL